MGTQRRSVQQSDGTSSKPGSKPPESTASGGTPLPGTNPGAGTGASTTAGTNPRTGTGTSPAPKAESPAAPGTGAGTAPRARKNKTRKAASHIQVEPQSISGTVEEPPFPGGEESQQPGKQRKPRKPRQQGPKVDGKTAARGLIEMVELFTVSALGYEAAMSPIERGVIEDPLARLIERYAQSVGQYSPLVDPIMLLAGVGMYAIRLDNMARQKQQAEKAAKERAARIAEYERNTAAYYPGGPDPVPPEQPQGVGAVPDLGADPQPNGNNPTGNISAELGQFFGGVYGA